MVKKLDRKRHVQTAYWSLVAAAAAMVVSISPVFADTIWDRFSTIMRDFYGQIVGITKFSGKSLREVLTIDPGALRWLATKYQGDETIRAAAQRICEYAVQQAS